MAREPSGFNSHLLDKGLGAIISVAASVSRMRKVCGSAIFARMPDVGDHDGISVDFIT